MKQLKLIIRSLIKNSRLNGINLFSMALGLVAAGIILTYVYQEYHYDSGNENAENIYRVEPSGYGPLAQTLRTNLPEIKETTRVSFFYGYLACSAGENKFNETFAIFADPTFFDLFSFPLVKGNKKECLNTPNSVALSETAAHKYFGDSDPIGKTLKIGSKSEFTVEAVYKDFKANSNFKGDLVLPLGTISHLTQIWVEPSWDYRSDIHTFALLTDHANLNELAKKTEAVVAKHTTDKEDIVGYQQLKSLHVDNTFDWESTPKANIKYLHILLAIAAITLFISSANFLFLFIGIKAQYKVNTGVKKVCGASRQSLFVEYFKEVSLQMSISLILALLIFSIYQKILHGFLPFLPTVNYFDYKLGLILFLVVLIVVSLAGFYPSITLSSQRPVQIFSVQKQNRPGKVNIINKLVIVQFALCILFISATLMMYKQVHFMEKQDTGYAKDELITIPLNMHIGEGIFNEKFDIFANELKKYPEIKDVTMAFSSPTSGSGTTYLEGKTDGEDILFNWESVSYDYFKTLGVKTIIGRTFSPDFQGDQVNWDNHTSSYVLNKSAVEALGLEDPIGKEFKVWGFKGPIIGVVENYHFQSMRSAISPMFFSVDPFYLNEIIVRLDPHSPSALANIQKVWEKFVPEFPVDFHFVNDQIKALYKPEEDLANTLNIFSILAIIIASMGLFTLTILTMNQRTKEIGIRKVNGAKTVEILTLLNRNFVKWVIIAFVIALPLAWFVMNKWLESFAYKTTLSWWIFALAGALALSIALLTVSWQSWRAATRNPVEALRYE